MTTSRHQIPASSRRLRHAAGIAAMVAGLVLLTGAALVTWQHQRTEPLYVYQLEPASAVAAEHASDPVVRKGSLVGEQGRKLASFEMIESASGPILTKWAPAVDAPFLTLLPASDEVTPLAEVMARHAHGHKVFAWWDSSRQMQHLADIDVAFGQRIGLPLFIPKQWKPWSDSVRMTEEQFWGAFADESDQARFRRFAEALVMDEQHGMQALRELAGGQPSVLVLHIRDAILLGQMLPSRFGVAFREFTQTGDVHSAVTGVRGWLTENDYPAYTVMRTDGSAYRAIALTDQDTASTLAARLLPFLGNDQHDVDGATLVYRTGGFIVFEIAGDPAITASGTAQ